MFNLLEGVQIYLAAGATDMRNSITGLSYLVEKRIKRNPRDRQLYLFCNRDRNRLKILQYDDNGYWLYYKRLELGRFVWPKETEETSTVELNEKELLWLLHGTQLLDKRALETEKKAKLY